MIRFIDLTGQITLDEDDFYFAWYNTVNGCFISIDDTQIWDSWEEFEKDVKENNKDLNLARFKNLFPENKLKIQPGSPAERE